jgi:hypothetical protein
MEPIFEQTGKQLIVQLTGQLTQHEDAETAISVYKTAIWIISQLEEVKHAALILAEQEMRQKGLEVLKTLFGSAGWTKPQAKHLNERAWQEALARDPESMKIQREFDLAQAVLQRAQEPYMELPEPRFYIH